ncbi:hypothetical protein CTAYLR_003878 [Chrysophaeum taylorii]|uniref:Uncharacterized protein n=1 Tax=Chrysophaeum taylorii TaxID=2483200 RepID=A0AAD7XQ67_9STRA|nr:hypothetical protein CTAYLR_003878 [Chrysophaeum taylorii]
MRPRVTVIMRWAHFQRQEHTWNVHRLSRTRADGFSGMEVVFLGTSAGGPQATRGTTAIAMRLAGHSQVGGHTWLFDCGEGTQRQLLSSTLSHAGIDRVFVSHMHGDHVWGLASVAISTLLEQGNDTPRSLHVYGPVGLHSLLVSMLACARCKLGASEVVVHELVDGDDEKVAEVPYFVSEQEQPTVTREQLDPDDDGVWHLYEDAHFQVRAARVRHTAPCFGFVVDEKPRKLRIDAKRATEAGLPPGKDYRRLQAGNDVALDDGTIVRAADVTLPPVPARRVAVVGDTCRPSKEFCAIANGADVVVHEATMADEDRERALARGHSTPSMAGKVARDIDAGLLVLTHFSGRFVQPRSSAARDREEGAPPSVTVDGLVSQARRAFRSDSVIAAHDFLCLSVPIGGFTPMPPNYLRSNAYAKNPARRHQNNSQYHHRRDDVDDVRSTRPPRQNASSHHRPRSYYSPHR